MSKPVCRWGILGTAGIAQKNWRSIWNAGNATLTGVASRSPRRSEAFINACQAEAPFVVAPRPFDQYEAMLESDEVDAVYIPLPTGMRKEWVVKAAEAGKHVLAEKPCGVDVDEVREMIEVCQRNRVQYMDGVMFMHSARLPKIRELLEDGTTVGRLRRMVSHHAFNANEDFLKNNIRLNSTLEPAGSVGDLGWYSIRFFLWVMQWRMPSRVTGRILTEEKREDSPHPVPMELSGELLYDDGVSASFYCSFVTENQQWVNLGGTLGCIIVPDFVLPFYGAEIGFRTRNAVFDIQGTFFDMKPYERWVAVDEYSSGHANAQETKLFRRFSDIVVSGKLEPEWGDMSLKTQMVMDACLESAASGSSVVEI